MGAHLYTCMTECEKSDGGVGAGESDRQTAKQHHISYFHRGLPDKKKKKIMKSRKRLFSVLLHTDTEGSCKRN